MLGSGRLCNARLNEESQRDVCAREDKLQRLYWKEELRIIQGHYLFHSSFHISLALFTLTLFAHSTALWLKYLEEIEGGKGSSRANVNMVNTDTRLSHLLSSPPVLGFIFLTLSLDEFLLGRLLKYHAKRIHRPTNHHHI